MADERFKVTARVSSSDLRAIQPVFKRLIANGSVRKAGDDLVVEAEMEGGSARELNRSILSALRRAEKRTRIRAEWTSDDGTTYRFFDYVLKKTLEK